MEKKTIDETPNRGNAPAEIQIREVLDNVATSFSMLDMDAWFQCFHSPFLIVLPNAVISPSSASECQKLFQPLIDRLRTQDFAKTKLESVSMNFLTETTAIVATDWTRNNSHDEVIETLGATYLFAQLNGSWRIAVVTLHTAGRLSFDAGKH